MRRLCIESSCSYPGRSVQRAVRRPMGVGLRPNSKELESPPNPKGLVVAKGAGLRATLKEVELPPAPTATRAARQAATSGVSGQKSAAGILGDRLGNGAELKAQTQ